MLGKGWTQAELARRADVLKDSVSNYVRGNITPTGINLEKLAKALGVKPEELYPNLAESAIAADTPSLELKVSTSDPTVSWLTINRMVRTSTAAKIIELLEADDAVDRS